MSAMASPELLGERVSVLAGEHVHLRMRRARLASCAVALVVIAGLGGSVPTSMAPPRPLPVRRLTAVHARLPL